MEVQVELRDRLAETAMREILGRCLAREVGITTGVVWELRRAWASSAYLIADAMLEARELEREKLESFGQFAADEAHRARATGRKAVRSPRTPRPK